ncbi:MAG TPA: VCBS repeat-containing protein, partial [Gemmataceae bacterium]|nr:VCBS repeat-containing protein [Gemmataceae bacterium]
MRGKNAPVQAATPGDDAIWFRDDTAAVGLNFVHEAGPVGRYFMPQVMGSGAALLDYDNDGRFDLYLVQNGGPASTARNKLFHQRADGRFEDVSAGSGLDISGYGMGVAVGDIDNDGFADVYISQYGGGRLFRNRGNGTFQDITRSAGVEQSSWGTSCCFVDYDRDGWLDLVVVNYVEYDAGYPCGPASGKRDYCHPSVFPGSAMRLFHNRGRDASGHWLGFEDVTQSAGVAKRGPG